MFRVNYEGTVLLAMAMMRETFYLGLTRPEEVWTSDNVPEYVGGSYDFIGFLKEQRKVYVMEDENGTIHFNGKRYIESVEPTRTIALTFLIEGEYLDGAMVYQEIVGSRLKVENENKMWYLPSEVDSSTFIVIGGENLSPYSKSVGSSETLTVVFSF